MPENLRRLADGTNTMMGKEVAETGSRSSVYLISTNPKYILLIAGLGCKSSTMWALWAEDSETSARDPS